MLFKYVTITTADAVYAALAMGVIACIIGIVICIISFYTMSKITHQTIDNHMTAGTKTTCKMKYLRSGDFGRDTKRPVYQCDCGAFCTNYSDLTNYYKPKYCPNCGRLVIKN